MPELTKDVVIGVRLGVVIKILTMGYCSDSTMVFIIITYEFKYRHILFGSSLSETDIENICQLLWANILEIDSIMISKRHNFSQM